MSAEEEYESVGGESRTARSVVVEADTISGTGVSLDSLFLQTSAGDGQAPSFPSAENIPLPSSRTSGEASLSSAESAESAESSQNPDSGSGPASGGNDEHGNTTTVAHRSGRQARTMIRPRWVGIRQRQLPGNSSEQNFPALEDNYLTTVNNIYLSGLLPDALSVLQPGRRHYQGHVRCFEYRVTGTGVHAVSILDRNLRDWLPSGAAFLEAIQGEDNTHCQLKLLLVEDLCGESIELLGQMFNCHPHFFAEHLKNSGYTSSKGQPLAGTELLSGATGALWPSITRKIPVRNLHQTIDWRQHRLLEGKWVGGFCPEPETCPAANSRHRLRLDSNIVRTYRQLSSHGEPESSNGTPLCTWGDKITYWQGCINGCHYVVMLLDPVSKATIEAVGVTSVPVTITTSGLENEVRLPDGVAIENRLRSFNGVWDRFMGFFQGSKQLTARIPLSKVTKRFGVSQRPRQDNQHENVTQIRREYTHTEPLYRPIRTPPLSMAGVTPQIGDLLAEQSRQKISLSAMDQISSILEHGDPGKAKDPLNILLQLFDGSLTAYISQVHRTLNEIRMRDLVTAAAQAQVLEWRSTLTKFRSDLTSLEAELERLASPQALIRPSFSLTDLTDDSRLLVQPTEEISTDTKLLMDDARKRLKSIFTDVDQAYTEMHAEITILDSQKSISEAESVAKLTELAFAFIPVTFVTGLFSMQIKELQNPAPAYAFVLTALAFVTLAYSVRLMLRSHRTERIQRTMMESLRSDLSLRIGQPVATHEFLVWAAPRLFKTLLKACSAVWEACKALVAGWLSLLSVVAVLAAPLIVLWNSNVDAGFASVITLLMIGPNVVVFLFVFKPLMAHVHGRLWLWNTAGEDVELLLLREENEDDRIRRWVR